MSASDERRRFLKAAAMTSLGWSAMNQNVIGGQESDTADSKTPLKERLLECLGGGWPERGELRARKTKTEQADGYRLEWVDYEVEPGDVVPAILLVPDGVTAQSPAPAVAIWHQHNGQWHLGKSEPAGLAGDPMHHTGVALAKLGYVVLCPDALCFEERQDPEKKLQGGAFERYEFLRYLVQGKNMAWKNILDSRRAIDYLVSRPEVRAEQIGCYGHSMGSTHTWLVGPWEPRLKCLVGNCCLPTYQAIHRAKILHCFPNFIPGFLQYGDTPDIAGLIAPRPLHLNFGEQDGGSPIDEVREGVKTIAAAYEAAGAGEQFSYYIEPDSGHVLSDEMWRRTHECFGRHLQ
jgi:dienelactone hydrolase